MDSKQIRSSVIARSMRFNGLFQPLHQERLIVIERQKQPKGIIQKLNSKSNSGFTVIPTKELCRAYLQKPDLLASKGIIHAQSSPPHSLKKDIFKIYGEMANHRKLGRRYDQQNLKSKLRHYSPVDPLNPKIRNSLRSFSPLGFGSDSQLRDRIRKKGQYISHEKKHCHGTTFGQTKDRVVREVGSKLKVCTSRDSGMSLERTCYDKVAADVKLIHKSSSGFISKDVDCSNASPGCQSNSEEAHQPSPVSVLEPICMEDMLTDNEEPPYLDLYGEEQAAREWSMAQIRDKDLASKKPPRTPEQNLGESVMICKSDAAWRKESELSGAGWVFTDCIGAVLVSNTCGFSCVRSPLVAEGLALRAAMDQARVLGFKRIQFESDSQYLINSILRGDPVSELYGIQSDVAILVSSFEFVSFKFIPREFNVMADNLAKQALDLFP